MIPQMDDHHLWSKTCGTGASFSESTRKILNADSPQCWTRANEDPNENAIQQSCGRWNTSECLLRSRLLCVIWHERCLETRISVRTTPGKVFWICVFCSGIILHCRTTSNGGSPSLWKFGERLHLHSLGVWPRGQLLDHDLLRSLLIRTSIKSSY